MANKYKKMFLDTNPKTLDEIVGALSILNAYSLAEAAGDDEKYFKKDGKELIEFTNWFLGNYNMDKLHKRFVRNWGGNPRILNIGVYLREQKALKELNELSKTLTSIQKENVDILFNYIWKKRCTRTLCFTFWDTNEKAGFVNFTLDKYIPKVKLDGFKGFIRGYVSKAILESGSLVLNLIDDGTVTVMGFDMSPKTITDISLSEMEDIVNKNKDESIKPICKMSGLDFKVDREVTKLNKDMLIDIFKEDLDEKNFESFIDRIDEVEEVVIPFIDDPDFENDYKDAIINFGDYVFKTYGKNKELMDFIDETYITSKPMILVIYNSLKNKKSNCEKYDTYINMFSKKLNKDEDIDNIISSLAYVNSYFVRNTNGSEEEADLFKENNKDSIIIFFHWFMSWFGDDDTKKLIKENWYQDPQIFIYAKSFMDLSEELDEYFDFLDETYEELSFTDKKNLDTILTYILNVPGEKSISFSSPDGSIENAIPVPDKINPSDDEEVESFEFLKKLLKGKLSLMLTTGGTVIIFRYPDDKNVFVSAISNTPAGIECVDPEIVQSDLYFSLEKKMNVEYEVADLVFI